MTSAEIIQAAFRVWGREFYLETSLSQVAHELGVSKSALFRHFRNKDALLEAMMGSFFDDFAGFIGKNYEKFRNGGDIFTLIRIIAEYYAQNVHAFIFSLTKLYDPQFCKLNLGEELRSRGVDIGGFHGIIGKNYQLNPLIMYMVFTTLTFYMAIFHKQYKSLVNPPAEDAISEGIDAITAIIGRGLGHSEEQAALDYSELEYRLADTLDDIEDDPLLKAVAGAVADAGPWKASMEQVARRSGLSKSSLYGHFKNKQDMLRQLFTTEFLRIIDFARQGMAHSELPEERLYLGIFSIAMYLRSKPDILVAMDWVRTRRLDLRMNKEELLAIGGGEGGPPREFSRLFEGIGIPGDEKDRRRVSHWILFLIINILMRPGGKERVYNEDIRSLHRFLTIGIKGFAV